MDEWKRKKNMYDFNPRTISLRTLKTTLETLNLGISVPHSRILGSYCRHGNYAHYRLFIRKYRTFFADNYVQMDITGSVLYYAFKGENLKIIKHLRKHFPPIHFPLASIGFCNTKLLRWYLQQYMEPGPDFSLLEGACSREDDDPRVLRHILNQFPQLRLDGQCWFYACIEGNVRIMKWIVKHIGDDELPLVAQSCIGFIQNGRTKYIDWAVRHNYCHMDRLIVWELFEDALDDGHLESVRWLYSFVDNKNDMCVNTRECYGGGIKVARWCFRKKLLLIDSKDPRILQILECILP